MTTPRVLDIDNILDAVQENIQLNRPAEYDIVVHRDDFRREGEWWYIVVHPTRSDIRGTEYMHILEKVEDELKHELGVNVLLVPTIED
jgi:hypothetical protein